MKIQFVVIKHLRAPVGFVRPKIGLRVVQPEPGKCR
jgi:hypothetical protein